MHAILYATPKGITNNRYRTAGVEGPVRSRDVEDSAGIGDGIRWGVGIETLWKHCPYLPGTHSSVGHCL